MTEAELLEALLGKEATAALGFVTLILVDHLEREHGMAHADACERLGSDEEKVGMLRLMFEFELSED